MPKTAEMAFPVPTKTFLSRSPDTAMLFAPFGCTHPPPPAPPSLLAQSLSLKDIAGCDIMKLKVSWHLKASLAGKRLKHCTLQYTTTHYTLLCIKALHTTVHYYTLYTTVHYSTGHYSTLQCSTYSTYYCTIQVYTTTGYYNYSMYTLLHTVA